MKRQVFYDLIHSPDDGGWYGQAFTRDGKNYFETNIYSNRQLAQETVLEREPEAVLIKIIE